MGLPQQSSSLCRWDFPSQKPIHFWGPTFSESPIWCSKILASAAHCHLPKPLSQLPPQRKGETWRNHLPTSSEREILIVFGSCSSFTVSKKIASRWTSLFMFVISCCWDMVKKWKQCKTKRIYPVCCSALDRHSDSHPSQILHFFPLFLAGSGFLLSISLRQIPKTPWGITKVRTSKCIFSFCLTTVQRCSKCISLYYSENNVAV